MRFKISVVCVLISICSAMLCSAANITLPDDSQVGTWDLSRKKRYLTFPSGSVVQVSIPRRVSKILPCVALGDYGDVPESVSNQTAWI
jgi:hypothetical protein